MFDHDTIVIVTEVGVTSRVRAESTLASIDATVSVPIASLVQAVRPSLVKSAYSTNSARSLVSRGCVPMLSEVYGLS